MVEGVAVVERGMETSRKSPQVLENILNSISDVTTQIHYIATAAEEQTSTTRDIAGNIHRVSSSVEACSHGSCLTSFPMFNKE